MLLLIVDYIIIINILVIVHYIINKYIIDS